MTLTAADQTARPGKTTTLIVRLEHLPGWHTYWINPGTGVPTTLKWTLPDGFTAGVIRWPTPIQINSQFGQPAGNGFEGTLDLPVDIAVPASAAIGSVHVKVAARWLMCAEGCIPGGGESAIDLKIDNTVPAPNAKVRAELASQPFPTAKPEWKMTAARSGVNVMLGIARVPSMKSPHFFCEDPFIRVDADQSSAVAGDTLRLTLPMKDGVPAPRTLRGILAYTDSSGVYRGVSVSTPIDAAP